MPAVSVVDLNRDIGKYRVFSSWSRCSLILLMEAILISGRCAARAFERLQIQLSAEQKTRLTKTRREGLCKQAVQGFLRSESASSIHE